jgi:hypothetical protein
MDNIFEQEKPRRSDQELFSKIWTAPALVFRYLEDQQYNKFTTTLLILDGLLTAWSDGVTNAAISGHYLDRIFPIVFLIILGNYLICYTYAFLMSLAGRWFRVRSSSRSLLRMIAFAQMPFLAGTLLSRLISLGNLLPGAAESIGPDIIRYSSSLPAIIGTCWTLVLYVIGIMEVLRLPAGKAVLVFLFPSVLIGLPLALLYFGLGR